MDLTDEEQAPWRLTRSYRHIDVNNIVVTLYHDAADRDATLMSEAQKMRGIYFKFNPLIAQYLDTGKIHCGGSLRDLWCDYPHVKPLAIRP